MREIQNYQQLGDEWEAIQDRITQSTLAMYKRQLEGYSEKHDVEIYSLESVKPELFGEDADMVADLVCWIQEIEQEIKTP